jgi:hypothetical protein
MCRALQQRSFNVNVQRQPIRCRRGDRRTKWLFGDDFWQQNVITWVFECGACL